MNRTFRAVRNGAIALGLAMATQGVAIIAVGSHADASVQMSTTTTVNVRSGPGSGYAVLGVLGQGQSVTATGDSQNGWTPVNYDGQTGWIDSSYVSGAVELSSTVSSSGTGDTGTTTTAPLNVRSGPGTNYSVVTVLSSGASVSLTGQSDGVWRQIDMGGYDEWVSGDYLSGASAAQSSQSSSSSGSSSSSSSSSASASGGTTCSVSWYATGTTTASGEAFDPDGYTAASLSLAFGTRLQVTNVANGKSVDVTVNDRGPYVSGRCLDLSRGAYAAIGDTSTGVMTVSYAIES